MNYRIQSFEMCRVFIDTNVTSSIWFIKIVPELLENKNVRATYSSHKKCSDEAKKNRNLLRILQQMATVNRLDEVPVELVENGIVYLEANQIWDREAACDDAHYFAMNFQKPTPYIFTNDHRIAKCRDKIKGTIGNKYCNLKIITGTANYKQCRHKILA